MTALDEDPLSATTTDAFLGGRVTAVQPAGSYRSGIDAVLLAAALPDSGRAASVLDAGAGVGVVGLCVAARLPHASVTLLEREPRLAELARHNVALNGFADRVTVVEADLLARGTLTRHLDGRLFHHALANPPYHVDGDGTPAADGVKARANAMAAGDLDRWIRFLAGSVVAGGTVTIIHRASALTELLAALERRFGAARVLPVHPRRTEPAVRIIVQARKGSRAPLSLLPGLVLHGDGNAFRPDVADILRHGAPLRIAP